MAEKTNFRHYPPDERIQYRKDQIAMLEQKLKTGVETFFTSEKYADFLKVMAKFHNYSFNNCVLIAQQCPGATFVAGFRSWKVNFHRTVKNGEKGIRIMVPMTKKETDPKTGEEVTHTFFRSSVVFDVSQTVQIRDMEPVPISIVQELSGNIESFDNIRDAIEIVSPVSVFYEDFQGEAKGYYSEIEDRIVIRKGMTQRQTVKTLIHEVTHAILHNENSMKKLDVQPDRHGKEIQAESTAFMVCAMLGIDTEGYSFPYIAGWCGKEMRKLNDSMTLIKETANKIYDKIIDELKLKGAAA